MLLLVAAHGLAAQTPAAGRFGHVEKAGRGEPTLILIPCLGCDWRSYDEFMERNADRNTMLAITWPGMGDTPFPALPSRETRTPLWDNLEAAMVNLVRGERLGHPVLVAHSAAAVHAVQFAARHGDLVRGVINVDAVITNWDWYGFTGTQRDSAAAVEMARVRSQYDSDEPWERFNRRAATSFRRPERRALYTGMWLLPKREAVLRYWDEWLRTDVGVLLPRVRVPVLSVYVPGTDDKDPDQIASRFRRHRAPANFSLRFVAGANHTILESHPAEFDAIVAEFVGGLPGTSQ